MNTNLAPANWNSVACQQGVAAYKDNVKAWDNPYARGTQQEKDWQHGYWTAAYAEERRENEREDAYARRHYE